MISVSMRGACALVACLSLWSGVMAAQVDMVEVVYTLKQVVCVKG